MLATQASDEELREALRERCALEIDGRWRLVDPSYLGHVLELLLVTACEHGWPRSAVPAENMGACLCSEADIDPRSCPTNLAQQPCSSRGCVLTFLGHMHLRGSAG